MLHDGGDAHGAVPDAGGIVRCATALEMWIRHMLPLYRAATIRGRRHTLERFVRDLGNPALKGVKPQHITDWLASLTGCGPASTRVALSHLRCFFKWAVLHHHLKVDPTATIPKVKQPRQVPRASNADEVGALLAVLPDERAHLVVALAYDMGLRRGEISSADISDVELREGVMRVTGKGGHARLLPITPTVRTALIRYLSVRGPGAGPLIRSQCGTGGIGPERVGQMVRAWMREAGVKHAAFDGKSTHALRHLCAETMYRHGADLRTIASALGHAHPSTTWIYLRHTSDVDELRAAMGKPLIDPPLGVSQVLDGHRGTWNRPFPAYQVGAPALREVGQSLRSA